MAFKDYIPVYGDVPQLVGGLKDTFGKNKTAKRRVSGAVRAGAAAYGIGSSLAGAATGATTGAAIGALGGPADIVTVPLGALVGAGIGAFTGGGLGKLGAKAGINSTKFIAKYGSKKAVNKATQQAAIRQGANPALVKTNAAIQNIPYNMSVGFKKFNDYMAKNPLAPHPYLTYIGAKSPQVIHDALSYGFYSDSGEGEDVTPGNNGSIKNGSAYRHGGGSYGYGVGGSGGVGGLTPEQQNNILQQIAQGGSLIGDGYSDYGRELIDRYMMNQSMMDPYRKNLQNYIRDYNNRADLAYNQDRELAALTGLTGNNAYAQMIGKNNALVNEANRLGLFKTAGEDLKNAGEGLDTLLGNMDLARQVGLPLSAANADTKMAQLAVNKMINDNRDENKLQIAQYNGALKLQIAREKAKMQMYRRAGNMRAANDSYKRLRALIQAAGSGIPIETINAYTGLNIPAGVQSTGEVRLER